ncbi:MAG: hypothetical protein V3574_04250 [Candidatus Moraniibacteriota bacterium]
MASLGTIANAIKSGAAKVGSKIGTKAIPGVGTAVGLLWPTAMADDSDIDMNDSSIREWQESQAKKTGSNNSSQYMTPISQFPAINDNKSSNSSYGGSSSGGGSANNNDSKIISQIGKGWDDAGDELKDAENWVNKSKNYISNLGEVKKQYINALNNYKGKTDSAISGNKELIQKNQKGALDDLAGDLRQNVDNTNIMLGIKGASGGSASKMASRAIAKSAGKQRAGLLRGFGDQISEQNQNATKASEEYNTLSAQADTWEEEALKQAWEDYNEQKKALDRLKKKKGGWEKEDIEAKSTENLQGLMSSISYIKDSASNFRAGLENKMKEFGGSADALNVASIDISAPAELDTPEFNENIDLENPENAEDWYDPNNKGKKRIVKGYDVLGNPIYEDEEELMA